MSADSTGLDDGIFPLSPSFAMDFAWLAPLPTYRGIQCPASLPSEALKGRTRSCLPSQCDLAPRVTLSHEWNHSPLTSSPH